MWRGHSGFTAVIAASWKAPRWILFSIWAKIAEVRFKRTHAERRSECQWDRAGAAVALTEPDASLRDATDETNQRFLLGGEKRFGLFLPHKVDLDRQAEVVRSTHPLSSFYLETPFSSSLSPKWRKRKLNLGNIFHPPRRRVYSVCKLWTNRVELKPSCRMSSVWKMFFPVDKFCLAKSKGRGRREVIKKKNQRPKI